MSTSTPKATAPAVITTTAMLEREAGGGRRVESLAQQSGEARPVLDGLGGRLRSGARRRGVDGGPATDDGMGAERHSSP